MSRARDNANLGTQAGSGLDASDITTGVLPVGVTGGSGLNAVNATTGVKPHIIPDVLYPSSGNDLAGDALVATVNGPNSSTVASSKYGTVQASDGRMYYYTDIKGSKPIKDPRIGSHFGSQRYKFKSTQLLEQETATHGENVYSVDGREWLRVTGANVSVKNDGGGNYIQTSDTGTASIIEATGYFNDINLLIETYNNNKIQYKVNGGTTRGGTIGDTTVSTPLSGRFVDKGSLINLDLPTSDSIFLGIHTISIFRNTATDSPAFGIELIAQDKFTDATCDYNNDPTITHDANTLILAGMFVSGTGIPAGATVASVTSTTVFELSASTTTGSVTNGTLTFSTEDIQIPSQNVVSYGKKFTVSGTPHYDPFNGFTNSTTLHSAVVDTATSLGLSSAPGSSVSWAISGSNNIRPYNGGRVVKWVDSAGVIKTSVNMMPPNAQNVLGTVAGTTEVTTPSATNATYTPIFSDDAIDHSQAEVAKTWHWREFGNGAANQGSDPNGTLQDFSMLNSADDVAYVMDDGLTSLSGDNVTLASGGQIDLGYSGTATWYSTFIGTGISIRVTDNAAGTYHLVQNLPYGTHILKNVYASGGYSTTHIDGVDISQGSSMQTYGNVHEFTFYQPKMPPIPEDAVVIADYMLMADFVPQATEGIQYISKGVRLCTNSRDILYNPANNTSTNFVQNILFLGGFEYWNNAANLNIGLYAFGTNFTGQLRDATARSKLVVDGTTQTSGTTLSTGSDLGGYGYLNSDITLGVHKFGHINNSGSNGAFSGYSIASPIHTSSHYQSFETPYLHELVGGDRNMEQTNLVVTPDGKTWDEVTRDVSYIGNVVLNASTDTATAWATAIILDEWRGLSSDGTLYYNKDWAIAYNRVICLKEGWYKFIKSLTLSDSSGTHSIYSFVTATNIAEGKVSAADQTSTLICLRHCQKGEAIGFFGETDGNVLGNKFIIERA